MIEMSRLGGQGDLRPQRQDSQRLDHRAEQWSRAEQPAFVDTEQRPDERRIGEVSLGCLG
jgi:hypothetical protein